MTSHYLPIGGPWVGPGLMQREALCGALTNLHFNMPTCPECLARIEAHRFLYWIDRERESPAALVTQQG